MSLTFQVGQEGSCHLASLVNNASASTVPWGALTWMLILWLNKLQP